jgi:SAM-dependent methyltransferase
VAALLQRSIFFHLGRCGGYSVRDFLVRSNLFRREIGAFHDPPQNVAAGMTDAGLFSFTFVRHPLTWLRSYWLHETENGWTDNDFASCVRSDSFAGFLERCVAAYPNGAATENFRPFLDGCGFIGRVERLRSDLGAALIAAQESFDTGELNAITRTNEIGMRSLFAHARAPRGLWELVLRSESGLMEELGYEGIPDQLVDERAGRGLVRSPFFDSGEKLAERSNSCEPDELFGSHRFEHRFVVAPGVETPGYEWLRREELVILEALKHIAPDATRTLDLGCGDGFFALHAERLGAKHVTALDSSLWAGTRDVLIPLLDSKVEYRVQNLFKIDLASTEPFDLVIFTKVIHHLAYPYLALALLGELVASGGTLLISAPVIDYMEDWPGLFRADGHTTPHDASCITYFNEPGLRLALREAGFELVETLDSQREGIDRRPGFERFSKALAPTADQSRHSALRWVVFRATKTSCPVDERLRSFWRSGEAYIFGDPPVAADAGRLMQELRTVERALHDERHAREIAERSLTDRETDLIETRKLASSAQDDELQRELDCAARAESRWAALADLTAMLTQGGAPLEIGMAVGQAGWPLLSEGWSAPESWGVWANAEIAVLDLPLPLEGPVRVRFRMVGYVPEPARGPQTVIVVAGAKILAEWKLSQHPIEQVLELHASDRPQRLQFRLPGAIAPLAIGAGVDPRRLSIGLYAVVIERTTDA